jgi:hypothetical protein
VIKYIGRRLVSRNAWAVGKWSKCKHVRYGAASISVPLATARL